MAEAAGWFSGNLVFRRVPVDPHLRRVQIETGLRCNLSCGYCYSMSGPGRRDRLSPDEVRSILHEADAMGVVTIDLTGGELLLDPEWKSYVTLARSRGMAVTIHTNGTLIRDAEADFLAAAQVSAVQVALDSHLDAVHDASRGHRGALARTLRGLDALARRKVTTRLSVMAHRGNIDTLGDTIGFMARRYPRAVLNVDRVISTGRAVGQDVGLTTAEFWGFIGPYLSDTVRSGKVCESPTLHSYEPDCGVAYSYVYVTAQGEIAACPTMTSRESESFRGPDARSVSLAAAWYDSAFFNAFRYTNCENVQRCPAGKICGGGCRSNAYVDGGYITAPDVVACNTHKNSSPQKVFVDFPTRYRQGQFDVVGT
jgi:radical SAM protein with 4Fe4S-binding SPASM domain